MLGVGSVANDGAVSTSAQAIPVGMDLVKWLVIGKLRKSDLCLNSHERLYGNGEARRTPRVCCERDMSGLRMHDRCGVGLLV